MNWDKVILPWEAAQSFYTKQNIVIENPDTELFNFHNWYPGMEVIIPLEVIEDEEHINDTIYTATVIGLFLKECVGKTIHLTYAVVRHLMDSQIGYLCSGPDRCSTLFGSWLVSRDYEDLDNLWVSGKIRRQMIYDFCMNTTEEMLFAAKELANIHKQQKANKGAVLI